MGPERRAARYVGRGARFGVPANDASERPGLGRGPSWSVTRPGGARACSQATRPATTRAIEPGDQRDLCHLDHLQCVSPALPTWSDRLTASRRHHCRTSVSVLHAQWTKVPSSRGPGSSPTQVPPARPGRPLLPRRARAGGGCRHPAGPGGHQLQQAEIHGQHDDDDQEPPPGEVAAEDDEERRRRPPRRRAGRRGARGSSRPCGGHPVRPGGGLGRCRRRASSWAWAPTQRPPLAQVDADPHRVAGRPGQPGPEGDEDGDEQHPAQVGLEERAAGCPRRRAGHLPVEAVCRPPG